MADISYARALFRLQGWRDLAQARLEPMTNGMSDASVFRIADSGRPDRYLKIGRGHAAASLRQETARTLWLASHQVRVPEVLRVDERDDAAMLLTAAVPGFAADASPLPPDRLIDALARGLKALHALPAADCPFDETIATRLTRAAAAVAAGDVDPDEFATRNLGVAPESLLARLTHARPDEDIAVIHGDATLSNIFVDGTGAVGFIDCGNAGRGDRYTDIAVLMAEIEEAHGPKAAARFAQNYGAPGFDEAKARYFADLYELF